MFKKINKGFPNNEKELTASKILKHGIIICRKKKKLCSSQDAVSGSPYIPPPHTHLLPNLRSCLCYKFYESKSIKNPKNVWIPFDQGYTGFFYRLCNEVLAYSIHSLSIGMIRIHKMYQTEMDLFLTCKLINFVNVFCLYF